MENIKVAIITGGNKGIGYGIAKKLVEDGIKVAITGRSLTDLNQAIESLNSIKEGFALGFVSDVRSLDSQIEVLNAVLEKWNRLDYFIANAGVGHFASIQEMTSKQWQETIDVNLTGLFNSAKASLSALKDTKGYFISISSLAGTNFFAKGTAYNASKFGAVGFTQSLMLDVRNEDIKVTTIMPGSVATAFAGHSTSDADAWKIQSEDIGQIVSDLIKMPARTLPSKIEVRPSKTSV